jgi:hypothetical protein
MHLSSGQQNPPPDEEAYNPAERPLTPATLLWRLWLVVRRRRRLFERADDPETSARAGKAAAPPSPTLGQLLVRLLPAWILLAIILVLAPGLPLRVAASAVEFVRNITRREIVIIVVDPGPTPTPVPQLSPVFTPEVDFWEEDIAIWSLAYQIHPNLIATIMQIESCGDPGVVSNAEASGLFQVTSIHFEAGEKHLDPQDNARAGLTFFAYLMELSGGDVGGALAGYNAGEWAVDAAHGALPDETQRYVYWGTGIYEEAQSGVEESARLAEWLEAGGVHLCEGAAIRLGLEVTPMPPEEGS